MEPHTEQWIELPHCTTYSESVVEVEDPAEDVDHVGHEALELVVTTEHLAALLDHDIIRVPQLCHGYFIFWTIQLYNFFDNSGWNNFCKRLVKDS